LSYSLDANLLLYASNAGCPEHAAAHAFLTARVEDRDLCCLAWPTVFAYLRIATHPTIFAAPLKPADAWANISGLMSLPRVRMIAEDDGFAEHYQAVTRGQTIRGNLVPDAHLAALLHQHGVRRLYSADADFRRFSFLEVLNPLAS
jgi:hypothetical protein